MSLEKRVSIGVDELTYERLTQLEKVTGTSRREHVRRAVERYFNDAPSLFTAPVVEALSRMPTSLKERNRLDRINAVAPGSKATLRRKST